MSDPFDYSPESLPGYNLNEAVPGAHAAPEGGGPAIDTKEIEANISSGTADDGFVSGQLDPASLSRTTSANEAMAPDAIDGMRSEVSHIGDQLDQQRQQDFLPPAPSDLMPMQSPMGFANMPMGGGGEPGPMQSQMTMSQQAQQYQGGSTATAEGLPQAMDAVSNAGANATSGDQGILPPLSFDHPNKGFEGTMWTGHTELGYDPVAGSNLAQPGDEDIWKSPLGGINDAPTKPSEELGYDPVAGSNISDEVPLGEPLGFNDSGYDPVTGSNLTEPGDLFSANPSLGSRLYSG
jgi:hypothetical protein